MGLESSDWPICPKCQSKDTRRILYGYVVPTAQLDLSKYVLGGCELSFDADTTLCKACGFRWRELRSEDSLSVESCE